MDRAELSRRLDDLSYELTRLRQQHQYGDPLAAMEVCSLWRDEELPIDVMPVWVLEHLAKVAVDYMDASPFNQVTPRAYIDMTSKERAKSTPSLDRIAGMTGTKGRDSPWLRRAKSGRHPYVVAFARNAEREARAGKNEIEVGGRRVRVLNAQGQMTAAFKDAIGRVFRVDGFADNADDPAWSKARTVDKILKDTTVDK